MSLIMSGMGYCNNTPWGLPANQLNHLQKILNAAACIVTRGNSQYITSVLKSLHCLPISNTNRLSLTQYVYKLYHNASNETSYPMQSISFSLILFPEPTNHLWFQRAHTHKNSLCTNSSHSAAPTLWNRLPGTLLNSEDCFSGGSRFFFQLLSHLSPSQELFSQSLLHPSPHSSLHAPFLHHVSQGQWACGCLNGVKLCYPSILRSWWAQLDMLTVSETLPAYMSMVRAQIILTFLLN